MLWDVHMGAPGRLSSLAIILPKVSLINGEGGFPDVLEVRVHGFAHGVAGRTGGTWQANFDPPTFLARTNPRKLHPSPSELLCRGTAEKAGEEGRVARTERHSSRVQLGIGVSGLAGDPCMLGKSRLARAK